MLLYILNYCYLCIWAILLIHCLRSSRFYPIFGSGWGTKIFWLFTFVFFNPLLSLLYILCVFCPLALRSKNKKNVTSNGLQITSNGHKRKTAIPAIVFTYTCIVIVLFEIPRTSPKMQPFSIFNKTELSNTENTILKSGLNIGFIDAKNKIQTVSSNSAANEMKVSLRSVMLICKSDHHLLDKIAQNIQKSLAKLSYVDTVAYYSYNQQPEPGGRLPDVYIALEMPVVKEDMFLLSRKLEVNIDCAASSSISDILSDSASNTSLEPTAPFKIQSQMLHSSRTLCIECPGTEYEHEVENISSELTEAIRKQFENLLDKIDELPVLPDTLYGTFIEPPEFSFIKNNVEFVISGIKLLKDNDTTWQFTEPRTTAEAFDAYQEELKNLGWTKISDSDKYLQMQKDNEVLFIQRKYLRDSRKNNIVANNSNMETIENPMIAHYSRCFAEDRLKQAVDMLLKNGIEIDKILLFRNNPITLTSGSDSMEAEIVSNQ